MSDSIFKLVYMQTHSCGLNGLPVSNSDSKAQVVDAIATAVGIETVPNHMSQEFFAALACPTHIRTDYRPLCRCYFPDAFKHT